MLLVTIPLVGLSLRFVKQVQQEQAQHKLEDQVRQALAYIDSMIGAGVYLRDQAAGLAIATFLLFLRP